MSFIKHRTFWSWKSNNLNPWTSLNKFFFHVHLVKFPKIIADEIIRIHHVPIHKFPRLIADEMVRMHQVNLPSLQKEMALKPVSQYQEKMRSWLASAPTHFDNPTKQTVYVWLIYIYTYIYIFIYFKAHLLSLNMPDSFIHRGTIITMQIGYSSL